MTATLPFVSHAPRPYTKPSFTTGSNCPSREGGTTSRCVMNTMSWHLPGTVAA